MRHRKRLERHLTIDAALLQQVDALLHDPIRNKPKYGGFSTLVENLIHEYLLTNPSSDDVDTLLSIEYHIITKGASHD